MATVRGKKLPSTALACDLFDVSLLVDLECENGDDAEYYPVFYLGTPQELAAGIRGGQWSPSFPTITELEAFCLLHEKEFRRLSEADEWPDDILEWKKP